MKLELSQTFMFESAHTLSRSVPLGEYQASKRIHGHTYMAMVTLTGEKGADGMLQIFRLPKNKRESVDLFYVRKAIAETQELLDHRLLDEVEGLGAPTLENLCAFIFASLEKVLPVSSVSVSRASGDSARISK